MLLPLLISSVLLNPSQPLKGPPLQASSVVAELSTHPDWPKAGAEDIASPHAVVAAFFSAISAPKGGTLNRQRLLSLFTPGGRIEIPSPGTKTKPTDVVFMSADQYADLSDGATAGSGFFDHLIAAHIQQFGVMAHVYAAYESRTDPADPKPFVRGVKSFELLNSAGRWYITQVSWDRERNGVPIPETLLHDHE